MLYCRKSLFFRSECNSRGISLEASCDSNVSAVPLVTASVAECQSAFVGSPRDSLVGICPSALNVFSNPSPIPLTVSATLEPKSPLSPIALSNALEPLPTPAISPSATFPTGRYMVGSNATERPNPESLGFGNPIVVANCSPVTLGLSPVNTFHDSLNGFVLGLS